MQAVLVMIRSDGERRSFSVTRDMTVIGRREDCDLRIPLSEVSRKHARLVRDGDALRLEDLGSSNGTFLNGQRVQEAILSPGDSVQIGPVVFVLQVDGIPADDELTPVSVSEAEHATPSTATRSADMSPLSPTAQSEHADAGHLEPLPLEDDIGLANLEPLPLEDDIAHSEPEPRQTEVSSIAEPHVEPTTLAADEPLVDHDVIVEPKQSPPLDEKTAYAESKPSPAPAVELDLGVLDDLTDDALTDHLDFDEPSSAVEGEPATFAKDVLPDDLESLLVDEPAPAAQEAPPGTGLPPGKKTEEQLESMELTELEFSPAPEPAAFSPREPALPHSTNGDDSHLSLLTPEENETLANLATDDDLHPPAEADMDLPPLPDSLDDLLPSAATAEPLSTQRPPVMDPHPHADKAATAPEHRAEAPAAEETEGLDFELLPAEADADLPPIPDSLDALAPHAGDELLEAHPAVSMGEHAYAVATDPKPAAKVDAPLADEADGLDFELLPEADADLPPIPNSLDASKSPQTAHVEPLAAHSPDAVDEHTHSADATPAFDPKLDLADLDDDFLDLLDNGPKPAKAGAPLDLDLDLDLDLEPPHRPHV